MAVENFDVYIASNFNTLVELGCSADVRDRGGFNGRPLVQWPTRPLGGWALEALGPLGPPEG